MGKMTKLVKNLGLGVVKGTVNSASMCYTYQPKQPSNIKAVCAAKKSK